MSLSVCPHSSVWLQFSLSVRICLSYTAACLFLHFSVSHLIHVLLFDFLFSVCLPLSLSLSPSLPSPLFINFLNPLSVPTLSSWLEFTFFHQGTAQNPVFLLGYQAPGFLTASPPGGLLSAPQNLHFGVTLRALQISLINYHNK